MVQLLARRRCAGLDAAGGVGRRANGGPVCVVPQRPFCPRLDALGLRDVLYQVLDDLYSQTNPQVLRTIGESYTIDGDRTIQYPFAVLEHSNGAINVLLVEP